MKLGTIYKENSLSRADSSVIEQRIVQVDIIKVVSVGLLNFGIHTNQTLAKDGYTVLYGIGTI